MSFLTDEQAAWKDSVQRWVNGGDGVDSRWSLPAASITAMNLSLHGMPWHRLGRGGALRDTPRRQRTATGLTMACTPPVMREAPSTNMNS